MNFETRMAKTIEALRNIHNGRDLVICGNGIASNYISAIPTVGGYQYVMREISVRGMGGGIYFPLGSEEILALEILCIMERIQIISPNIKKIVPTMEIVATLETASEMNVFRPLRSMISNLGTEKEILVSMED